MSLGRELVTTLAAELRTDPGLAAELAELLGPHLPSATATTNPDAWLTTKQAADHLGITVGALHRFTSARTIPFEQAGPGGKCWFKRSELDAWRAGR